MKEMHLMDYKFKIIIIGDPGVGKTSIVKKFVSGKFIFEYRASIGTNIYTKKITISSGDSVILQLFDIAGQERWSRMRPLYYKGSSGALIVGDLTRKKTFEQIVNFWYPDLINNYKKIPNILIANKSDLENEISEDYLLQLSKSINSETYFITSAKEGENIEKSFIFLAETIIHQNKKG